MTEQITIKTEIKQEVLDQPIVIENQESYEQAGDVLKLCKKKVKDLDEERKTYTAPLDESKKLIMNKFKEVTDPIKDFIERLEKEMSKWYVLEEQRRADLQKQLEDEAVASADDENPDVEVPVVQSIKKTKGQISTTSMVAHNTYEIIDETLIPREYLMPDEKKIGQAIRKGTEIEGIKLIKGFKPTSR